MMDIGCLCQSGCHIQKLLQESCRCNLFLKAYSNYTVEHEVSTLVHPSQAVGRAQAVGCAPLPFPLLLVDQNMPMLRPHVHVPVLRHCIARAYSSCFCFLLKGCVDCSLMAQFSDICLHDCAEF